MTAIHARQIQLTKMHIRKTTPSEEMCRRETIDLTIFGSDIESCVPEGHGIYQLKRINCSRKAWRISFISVIT